MGGEVSKPGGNLQNIKTRAQEATQAAAAKGGHNSGTIAALPALAGARDVHEKSIKDLSEAVMILSKKVGGSKKRKHTKKRKFSKKRKSTKKRKYTKKRTHTKKHRKYK